TAPGDYTVSLEVTDDEGCSVTPVSTGTAVLCNGGAGARTTRIVHVDELGSLGPPDPPCVHDGNDGFCGTPDQKAPQIQVLLLRNGANYSIEGAPLEFVGVITPDPSGYASVRLRLIRPLKQTTPKKKTTKKKKKKKHTSSKKKKKKKKRKKKKVTKAPA